MNRSLGLYLIVGFFIFSFTGCATYSNLTLDYDQNTDFSGYKTYAWASPSSVSPNLSLSQNDLIEARVKDYVDQIMTEKGYQEAPPHSADFLITYHNIYKEKQSIRTVGPYPYGSGMYLQTYCIGKGKHARRARYGLWADPYYYQPRQVVEYYTEGTFVLDVIDNQTKKLVWRGTATRALYDTAPNVLDEKMKEASFELLQKFPPPPPPAQETKAVPAASPSVISSPRADEPFVVPAVKQVS